MFSIFKKKKLDGDGERVDINYYKMKYDNFDMYQKSHYHRYKFAQNYIKNTNAVGDFACGSGYGTMMLSEKAGSVVGADLNSEVISYITDRYSKEKKVLFLNKNLLDLDYEDHFDVIISFETVEHFAEEDIPILFKIYNKALIKGGLLIFSTPYNQERCENAIKMGFHLTFYIVENTISQWLEETGFDLDVNYYQNYLEHDVVKELDKKDFIITVAKKK